MHPIEICALYRVDVLPELVAACQTIWCMCEPQLLPQLHHLCFGQTKLTDPCRKIDFLEEGLGSLLLEFMRQGNRNMFEWFADLLRIVLLNIITANARMPATSASGAPCGCVGVEVLNEEREACSECECRIVYRQSATHKEVEPLC